jgi:hypothetical protein
VRKATPDVPDYVVDRMARRGWVIAFMVVAAVLGLVLALAIREMTSPGGVLSGLRSVRPCGRYTVIVDATRTRVDGDAEGVNACMLRTQAQRGRAEATVSWRYEDGTTTVLRIRVSAGQVEQRTDHRPVTTGLTRTEECRDLEVVAGVLVASGCPGEL